MQRAFKSIFFSTLPLATLSCLIPLTAEAQVTADGTTSTAVNRNGDNFTIEKGDRVGDNLFHSFDEFSVPTLGSALFNNASDIANIFSRVTGSNISNIDGLIRANGAANLFLINPNGIIFGENARLNLGGSFFASTADSLLFEGNIEFSASNPTAPPLLEVNIPIGLNFRDNPGDISNKGNLTVEQDVTLSGGNLDLQGQLKAGENLTLQATDKVKVRDRTLAPFIAFAGDTLLIQGSQNIDISALNHSDSGLFAGGNMILRSTNPVGGDAHYWSGGNFRIEQLDGSLGDLFSPFDPIIFANGNINFANATTASLHILAGGSVNVSGTITITGTAPQKTIINPTARPELANITLSDNTSLVINGKARPTLDIRAGIDWSQLGGLLGNSDIGLNVSSEVFEVSATSSDLKIGSITVATPDGVVFLTNKFKPNTSLPEGVIEVGAINTNDSYSGFSGDSGSVTIDSSSDIDINPINSSSASGNAGDITVQADGSVTFVDSSFDAYVLAAGKKGGDIKIISKSLSLNNSELSSFGSIYSGGSSGNVTIKTQDFVNFDNDSSISTFTAERGSNILIETAKLTVKNSKIFAPINGDEAGGNLTINASDFVKLEGNQFIRHGLVVDKLGDGNAGDINVNTNRLIVKVEKYALGLTPGLQLLDPKPLTEIKLNAIAAGLSEKRDNFPALPAVEEELQDIKGMGLADRYLLNENFSKKALKQNIVNSGDPMIHLAIHAKFSPKVEKTFILTGNEKINIRDLDELLRDETFKRKNAIELLVLSACQTATGDSRATLGLAGVAVQSGARSTLATL